MKNIFICTLIVSMFAHGNTNLFGYDRDKKEYFGYEQKGKNLALLELHYMLLQSYVENKAENSGNITGTANNCNNEKRNKKYAVRSNVVRTPEELRKELISPKGLDNAFNSIAKFNEAFFQKDNRSNVSIFYQNARTLNIKRWQVKEKWAARVFYFKFDYYTQLDYGIQEKRAFITRVSYEKHAENGLTFLNKLEHERHIAVHVSKLIEDTDKEINILELRKEVIKWQITLKQKTTELVFMELNNNSLNIALNFASRIQPGGSVRYGHTTQEESLLRQYPEVYLSYLMYSKTIYKRNAEDIKDAKEQYKGTGRYGNGIDGGILIGEVDVDEPLFLLWDILQTPCMNNKNSKLIDYIFASAMPKLEYGKLETKLEADEVIFEKPGHGIKKWDQLINKVAFEQKLKEVYQIDCTDQSTEAIKAKNYIMNIVNKFLGILIQAAKLGNNAKVNLILGAIGCGAYNNNPQIVALCWKEAIEQLSKFGDIDPDNVNLIFAVPKLGQDNTYEIFQSILKNLIKKETA